MELYDSSKQHIMFQPIFLHGFSASMHMALFLVLLVSSLWKKLRFCDIHESNKERLSKKFRCYKQTLLCCFGVSLFNLVLCLLSYFYWYRNDWSDDKVVIILDLVLKTLSWSSLCVYLQTQFFNAAQNSKLPVLLRVWWGFYLSISCYCLVVNIVFYSKYGSSQLQFLVSDIVSVVTGLFFCFVGFLKNERENPLLEENLLIGDSSLSNELELHKLRGGDSATPYSNAGLFSLLTFSWISSLIAAGNKKTLNLEDVPQLYCGDSVVGVFPSFRNKLESDCNGFGGVTTFRLVKALFFTTWKDVLYTALLGILYTVVSYVGPYLIDEFVQCLDGKGQFKNQGYVLASTFFVAKLVECLSLRYWSFVLQQLGIKMRSVLVAMIYNKTLTLCSQSRQGQSSGLIINVMTVDAETVGDFSDYIHDSWLGILQVGLALIILYKNLGVAAISALFATVALMLLNIPLGRIQEKFQERMMESKDRRMKATSEILRNMRILKLLGWEMKFLSKILQLRKTETGWLKKFVYSSAMTSFLFLCTPTFVAVITFGTCILIGIPLESGKILSALATFRILQQPIYVLPKTISMMVQSKVSLDRIASFLRLDDLQTDVVEKLPHGSSTTSVEIVEGNFSWNLSVSNPTLMDVNLRVCHGMRVAVCGTVGSGKSSLLSCILGEVPKISGTVKVCGTKAYVAQSPWIQSGKIEENILFGKEMNTESYDRILEACALKQDLEVLPFGDQTVIGERGINLSGGQKQRVQIARALYQDADIYLFDDPFSAVDAHTGSHIFKEVLLGQLSAKTVIYVTHQVEFLSAADLILVMKDGRITQAGKYDDILNSGSDFVELVGAHKEALSRVDSKIEGHVFENEVTGKYGGNYNSDLVIKKEADQTLEDDKADEASRSKKQLVLEEEREKGTVGLDVYLKYITIAYGGALVPFILLAQILFQVLQIGSNYWMALATPMSEDAKLIVDSSTLLIVYVSLAVGSSFCILTRSTLLVTAGYKTATLLFNKMHSCIFRAPMSFFDATPSGRILSRVSTDQSALDIQIPNQVSGVAFSIIQLLGIIAVMSLVAWQVFAVFIPVMVCCLWYQRFYVPSARELSRLVGVSRAPLIQHFSETFSGSATIRSFDQQLRFQETNMKLMDSYSSLKFHIAAAMEWLSFRMDMLSLITFAFSLFFFISFPGEIDPAIAGLAVIYGLTLNLQLARAIWNICNAENKIISVERILQYIGIPSEPPLVIETNQPDHAWPSHGKVNIENLQVRYAPHLPLVLQGLTCTLPGGMKTGIVGRTGSGKSTLIQTLFRIVEPTDGQILIDNINISTIGLHDLRARLSIIPQDPTMFEGTVRSNLDPLEEYTDEQIWEALDKCLLGDEMRKKEMKLDSSVTENGENWSMGQRQLVCLGRVLLKKTKILVLDEATASVDTATDNLIQQTLRQHFSECTVITIAHRITSVLDSDMVLLLSHGHIQEYDSPKRLLENKSSSFSKLVADYTQRANTSVG